jgi:hypothetical protein
VETDLMKRLGVKESEFREGSGALDFAIIEAIQVIVHRLRLNYSSISGQFMQKIIILQILHKKLRCCLNILSFGDMMK